MALAPNLTTSTGAAAFGDGVRCGAIRPGRTTGTHGAAVSAPCALSMAAAAALVPGGHR